jgi:hypothetical protein
MTFIANKNAEHLGEGAKFPNLLAHTARCEALDPFKAAPFTDG